MEKEMFDVEHLPRTYFKMALPVVMGLVITLIYNLADTYFISGTGNTDLIAGVSVCSPVFTILMAFGNIYGQGGSSLISRLLGHGEKEAVRRVSSFCFYIAILTGVIIGMIMILFKNPFLKVIGADKDTISYAGQYFVILALGAPALILSFIHSNLLRCEGMATTSMVGTVGGAVINIILDPILIFKMNMGAAGAAIATVIGYLASDFYFMYIVHKKSSCLSMNPNKIKISGAFLRQILGIGMTAAITNFMQSLSIIMMNQFLLPYGNEKVAAMGIVLKVNMISQMILTGFAFGAVPVFGYLYGAKNKKKMKELLKFSMSFCCMLGVAFTVIIFILAPAMIGCFLKESAMIADGTLMLRLQVISTVCVAVVLLMTILYQATGKVIPAFLLSISRQGVVYIVVLVIAASLYKYQGIIAAQALADVVSVVLAVILFKKVNVVK